MFRTLVPIILILLAAFSRLLPHPPNVAPIAAVALFGGAYLDRKYSFVIPLAALALSDLVIGFYSGAYWTYAAFIAVGGVGLWLGRNRTIARTVAATLAGSIIFFLISNFGAWLTLQVLYPRTFSGLIECYTAAIPFFRNTLAGDAVSVALLFGAYELLRRVIPSLAPETEIANS
jgi:hypothetical protein